MRAIQAYNGRYNKIGKVLGKRNPSSAGNLPSTAPRAFAIIVVWLIRACYQVS